eukprot:1819965-Alexandrium_andersonii.AAC.1
MLDSRKFSRAFVTGVSARVEKGQPCEMEAFPMPVADEFPKIAEREKIAQATRGPCRSPARAMWQKTTC